MNIVPSTPINTLLICHNVPLDSTYKDTITFGSLTAQAQYFAGKAKYTFSNMGPTRLQNSIRVPQIADNLYDCNYIAFQNTNFGNKWFYAFITEIKFINTNMCEINFNIDVMQTWYFDYTLKPSFVEREHPNTDRVGDSLTLEPVDIGEYVLEPGSRTIYFDNYCAVLATSYKGETSEPEPAPENPEEAAITPRATGTGGMYGGLFSGLDYFKAELNSLPQIGALIDYLQRISSENRVDTIASTFIMPSDFYTNDPEPVVKDFGKPKANDRLGSYIPKNKKLLTYPYNMLFVSNSGGENHNYKYELFKDSDICYFNIISGMGCNPEMILVPQDYDGQSQNLEESIAITGFPQFAYAIDTFKAYLAQNANSLFVTAAFSAAQFAGNLSAGNIAGAAGGAADMISQAAQMMDMSLKPQSPRGAQGSNTMVATRKKDFYFYQRHVREDYAKIIDDYFDMYGYSVGITKIPNRTGRPYWNYVKTRKCSITGSIPFEDIALIRNIYDNGITFWHGDYVGAYNLNNSPGG